MEKEKTQKIIQAIKDKGVVNPCARCGKRSFSLAGLAALPILERPDVTAIGGVSVPVAMVICDNCGNVYQHALGPLDLMKMWKGGAK